MTAQRSRAGDVHTVDHLVNTDTEALFFTEQYDVPPRRRRETNAFAAVGVVLLCSALSVAVAFAGGIIYNEEAVDGVEALTSLDLPDLPLP